MDSYIFILDVSASRMVSASSVKIILIHFHKIKSWWNVQFGFISYIFYLTLYQTGIFRSSSRVVPGGLRYRPKTAGSLNYWGLKGIHRAEIPA